MDATQAPTPAPTPAPRNRVALLALTALGVVFGDIGTSPLYALRECFSDHYGLAVNRADILGVLSLIFWSLLLVVSVKYLVFVLRADNRGEGGILAITALVTPQRDTTPRRRWLILLGLFGAAMLYGDGMITPAISVMSAVEGLHVATTRFDAFVIPLTCLILVFLFTFQSHGTGRVGIIFGPVMLLWFTTLALLGLAQIAREPAVLLSLSPWYALRFFLDQGFLGFAVLGSVFLVVTGGEALYADMGHFGRFPIRVVWFAIALPGLMLNYLGQGALLLENPDARANPFYLLAPSWALYPLVSLATLAAIIASQALIAGAFSLTMQAVQLGYCPRMTIRHTSAQTRGQIYVPFVNWSLMLATIGLVLGFRSSTNLAAAYGVAVTSTMVITTLLFFVVAWRVWQWRFATAAALSAGFLLLDLPFFIANLLKVPHGGWFPIVVAILVFALMTTWQQGRRVVADRLRKQVVPLDGFLRAIEHDPPLRVPGTAVFMYSNPTGTPPALLHNLRHNKVLHERIVLLNVQTAEVPHVAPGERVQFQKLTLGFSRVVLRFGFMEEPDIPRELANLSPMDPPLDPAHITYFLGRENLLPTAKPGMARWREVLFVWMSRNAQAATTFFRLPPNRVVELGAQIEL